VAGLVCLLVFAGCANATSTQRVTLPVVASPGILAGYHIFVADTVTGNLTEPGKVTVNVSKSVHGLGLSTDGSTLYVTDIIGGRLVAYHLGAHGSLTLEHSVVVGTEPVHMVNTLDGSTIFVTNFGGSTVSVVNATTWKLIGQITVPRNPHGIVLSPDGITAYVACYGGSAVAIIDTASAVLSGTIALPVGAEPMGILISPDGRYLYVSDNVFGRVLVISTATRRIVDAVAVGQRPAFMALAPNGRALYVADGLSSAVTVLNLAPDEARPVVQATVRVQGYPHGIAVTPDGRYVVVADTVSGTVSIFATATDTVVATLKTGKYPNDVIVPAR